MFFLIGDSLNEGFCFLGCLYVFMQGGIKNNKFIFECASSHIIFSYVCRKSFCAFRIFLKPLVDDEAPEITPKQASRARLAHESHPEWYRVTPVKQQICIKIDKDVLDALKAEGKGYQTRINKILREAVLVA